jgi:hypothetical protein
MAENCAKRKNISFFPLFLFFLFFSNITLTSFTCHTGKVNLTCLPNHQTSVASMKQSQNRIKKELQEVRKDPNSGVTVEVDETSATLTHFFGIINGPDGTPYEVCCEDLISYL